MIVFRIGLHITNNQWNIVYQTFRCEVVVISIIINLSIKNTNILDLRNYGQ